MIQLREIAVGESYSDSYKEYILEAVIVKGLPGMTVISLRLLLVK